MQYIPVMLYTVGGEFRGHAILKDEVNKLLTNIWSDEEWDAYNRRLANLNRDTTIKQHWPEADDPEVQALLNDPEFLPYEQMYADVVDEDASTYVWKQDTEGRDTDELDEAASVVKTKQAWVPVRPSDVTARTRAAMEKVATERAASA